MTKGKKILIIKPSSLGDIVHSLPVLNAFYKSFPGADIHWLVASGFEGILEGHQMLKRIWTIRKDEWKKIKKARSTIRELRNLFRDLREERFDYVLDLQGLFRSGLIAKATGSQVRVGFMEAREGSPLFYTQRVAGGRDIHAVDRYLKIAAFLGCDITDVRFPFSPIKPGLDYKSLYGDYVVMAPGARGIIKRWPAQRFGELASLLPMKSIIIGSVGEKVLADEAVKSSRGNAVSIAGKTDLKEVIEVIRGARFMVSNDTGSMHIAAALGVPVFALFGPTNPVRTGPYGNRHVIIRKNIPCSPCYKRACKTVECLNTLMAKEVADIISADYKNLFKQKLIQTH